MRARYAAFATGALDFLLTTHHPDTVKAISRASIAAWSRGAEWLGLTILATELGGPADDTGVVEFAARYAMKGVVQTHHERSRFAKQDGHWFFVDGEDPSVPRRREGPVVGRNQPCSCGSGKKFKHCCARC